MGVIVWGPLAAGWLTGRYNREGEIDLSKGRPGRVPARFDQSIPGNQRKLEVVRRLNELADGARLSLTHLAMAFTLAHRSVTNAIIGPRTPDQLEDLLKGADERRAARSHRCHRCPGIGREPPRRWLVLASNERRETPSPLARTTLGELRKMLLTRLELGDLQHLLLELTEFR